MQSKTFGLQFLVSVCFRDFKKSISHIAFEVFYCLDTQFLMSGFDEKKIDDTGYN